MVDDHGIQLVGMTALDGWALEAGQQRVHSLRGEGHVLLRVAIDLLVS